MTDKYDMIVALVRTCLGFMLKSRCRHCSCWCCEIERDVLDPDKTPESFYEMDTGVGVNSKVDVKKS